MGRQKGQSQRTKGNVRPSSSGRAANLVLDNQGLVGFDALSGDLGYVPVLKSLEDDSTIDSDFRVTLSKLNKKDGTTKLKALSEFTDLCKNKDAEEVTNILSYWPRIYNRLSDDCDRKVRQATQIALHSLVQRVGKAIAPHLKLFMGSWWVAQSDPYAPAASAAINAFKGAFSSTERQAKALQFCNNELFQTLSCTIFSSQQTTAASIELNQDKERRLVASLNAFSSFLKCFNESKLNVPEECLQAFCSNPKLWKYAKHKSPAIKAAFYGVVASIVVTVPDMIADQLLSICKLTLYKLDESNPIICKSIWEAAVALTVTFKEWPSYIDARKGFLPALWGILKNGYYGNAKIVAHYLPSLVNQFPPSLSVMPVYQELLKCLSIGLQVESVKKSVTETKGFIASFIECMKLLLDKSITGTKTTPDWDIINLVLKEHLFQMLNNSIRYPDLHQHLNVPFFHLVAQLLDYFSNKSSLTWAATICSEVWDIVHLIQKNITESMQDASEVGDEFMSLFTLFDNFMLIAVKNSVVKSNSSETKHVKFAVGSEKYLDKRDVQDIDLLPNAKNQILLNDLEMAVRHTIVNVLSSNCTAMMKMDILSHFLTQFASFSIFEKLMINKKADQIFEEESESMVENAIDPAVVFIHEQILPCLEKIAEDKFTYHSISNAAKVLFSCIQYCKKGFTELLKITCEKSKNYGGKLVSILLLQHVLDNKFKLFEIDNQWLVEFLLSLIRGEESLDQHCRFSKEQFNDKWNLILSCLSSDLEEKLSPHPKLDLDSQQVFVIIECLNNLLLKNASTEVSLEIGKVIFSCFSAYFMINGISDLFEPFLINSLLCMIKLMFADPQALVLVTIKDCIGKLLKTAYACDNFQTKRISEKICKICATFVCDSVLNSEVKNISPSVQIVTVFAEELVMHHEKQDFIMEWIDCVFPSKQQMLLLRPSIESELWYSNEYLLTSYHSAMLTSAIQDNYYTVIENFNEIMVELVAILSESNCNLFQHSRLRNMFVEILLRKAVFVELADELINPPDFSCHFVDQIILEIVQNSVKHGAGWLLCLSEVFHWFSPPLWDPELILGTVELDAACLTSPLAGTLSVFAKACNNSKVLKTILNWTVQKVLQIKQSSINYEVVYSKALHIIVSTLKQINILTKSENSAEELESVYLQVTEMLIELKSSNENMFLYDCDLNVASSNLIEFNIEVMCFCDCFVSSLPLSIPNKAWDFIECSFVSWMDSCCVTFNTKQPTYELYPLSLLETACSLMKSLNQFMHSSSALNDPALPATLTVEWEEFFKPAAHTSLVSVFINLSKRNSKYVAVLMRIIGICLQDISPATLLQCSIQFEAHLTPESALSADAQTLLHLFCSSISFTKDISECYFQLVTTYILLNVLMQYLFKDNSEDSTMSMKIPKNLFLILNQVSAKVEETCNFLASQPSKYVTSLKKHELSDDEFSGDTSDDEDIATSNSYVESLPNTPYVLCYLIVWKLILDQMEHLPLEVRPLYLKEINSSASTSHLLSVLKQLLPDKPTVSISVDSKSNISMFENSVDFFSADTISTKIQHLSCSVFKVLVSSLPALLRLWFDSLNKLDRSNMDNYISKYVTPIICKEELDSVSKSKTPPGLKVYARPRTREVVATYEVSEADFEIAVQLPGNYPLAPVQVNTLRRVGVAASQWRYWILQMTMLLQHQNGKILDALLLWKKKVDKRLDGLEECMICFSIVHGTNSQSLPKLQCKTCKKKYHAECLYKWFDTSNQSSCPLCRSPMMFK